MRQRDPFTDSASSRTVTRPAQPRSNLARFKAGSTLAAQLREAEGMSSAGRHKVWEAVMPEVLPMFEELLGDSLIKVEREEAS